MPQTDLFLIFMRRFNQAGFRYVIGGSVAAIFYGEPRMTDDVALVVFLNETDIRRLPDVFPSADFYVPPLETIVTEVARQQRGHFNIIHMNTSFKADIYPTGRDELNAWAFHHKRPVEYDGETLMLARPSTSSSASWSISAKAARINICATSAGCSTSRASSWTGRRLTNGSAAVDCRPSGSRPPPEPTSIAIASIVRHKPLNP